MDDREILITIFGSLGAAFILFCFIANMAGKLSSVSPVYLYLNLVGGILVGFNSYWFEAYPAFAINFVWALASIWGLWNHRVNNQASQDA